MTSAIIVAAGKGTRMGPQVDKLLMEVAGRPVIAHTWQRYEALEEIAEIVCVVREGMQVIFAELAQKYRFRKPYRLVAGGKERQDSVWNGLEALNKDCDLVAIQDGARPCTRREIIQATLEAAAEVGAAVAAQRVTDTLKESTDDLRIGRTVDRSRLWAVQTPQTFRIPVIRQALALVRERQILVTDDTAACECIHQPVRLVECAWPNPKVTTPNDLEWIEYLLAKERSDN